MVVVSGIFYSKSWKKKGIDQFGTCTHTHTQAHFVYIWMPIVEYMNWGEKFSLCSINVGAHNWLHPSPLRFSLSHTPFPPHTNIHARIHTQMHAYVLTHALKLPFHHSMDHFLRYDLSIWRRFWWPARFLRLLKKAYVNKEAVTFFCFFDEMLLCLHRPSFNLSFSAR